MTKVFVNMFFANVLIDAFWRLLGSIMGPSGQYWRFLAETLGVKGYVSKLELDETCLHICSCCCILEAAWSAHVLIWTVLEFLGRGSTETGGLDT